MEKIAVEKSLKNIKSYLHNQGCDVTDLENNRSNSNQFDVVVVSGQNSNLLGMQDTNTKATVINAKGMSPQDVYTQVVNRFS